MKIKTLIKKLQKLDPESDIYGNSIFGLRPPVLVKEKMVYRRCEGAIKRLEWEAKDIFERRFGKHKATKIKEKTILTIR